MYSIASIILFMYLLLRRVGVIWFIFFMFSNLYWVNSTLVEVDNQTLKGHMVSICSHIQDLYGLC